MFNSLAFSYHQYFFEVNLLIGVFMAIIFIYLFIQLVSHMKQMVRLKYHSDERAEFDESRVKIVVIALIFIWFMYIATWIIGLLLLDKNQDFGALKSLFNMMNLTMLVGIYALFFLNNRILRDISDIKSITPTTEVEDPASNNFFKHL